MVAVAENPYEGPDANANIERDIAAFKAPAGMPTTAAEFALAALKERDVKLAAAIEVLEKANKMRSNACVAVVIAQEWIAEKDARIATLEAELAAAKATAQHWQGIAEQRREHADADLARVTIDRDTESERYRRASNDLAGVQQSLADARAELRLANLHYETADGNFLRMAKAYDDRGDEIDALRAKLAVVTEARYGGTPIEDSLQRNIERQARKFAEDDGDGEGVKYARALAAALLRAVDEAEGR